MGSHHLPAAGPRPSRLVPWLLRDPFPTQPTPSSCQPASSGACKQRRAGVQRLRCLSRDLRAPRHRVCPCHLQTPASLVGVLISKQHANKGSFFQISEGSEFLQEKPNQPCGGSVPGRLCCRGGQTPRHGSLLLLGCFTAATEFSRREFSPCQVDEGKDVGWGWCRLHGRLSGQSRARTPSL